MKILVTGSTGLVGKALVSALAKEGHSVCRLVRPGTNANDDAGGFNVAWNPETGELGARRLVRMLSFTFQGRLSRMGGGRKNGKRCYARAAWT